MGFLEYSTPQNIFKYSLPVTEAGTALKFPPLQWDVFNPAWAATDPGPVAVHRTLRAIPLKNIPGNFLCLGKFWDLSAL